ncbi:LacI family DNA-binding transcriptional regulator [Neobittarella massiliensis]|uniref:LacI family DNA-binding transcriptional regulator n=2 Tax=Oscillospiraceae TaxID=216572 RepID=A0A8J6INL3_9FIRM|nr:LacI family DNA-binding transcriptional regulator [Neobittarella massiliensis]MBC3516924.1 LacI family DNA-binding transcriptional regulator [Neobittarella massiliensis]SCJ81956.1 HTH-type transcriptional repressor CytR [uncultured Anaerotruncus sp.]
MKEQITIKDISQKAGVAISTVSRVLNGKDRVSQKTREKVQKIIDEYGYVPSAAAVSVVRKKTNMVGVIIPEIRNPFYSAIIHGVDMVCRQKGYNVCMFSTGDEAATEEELVKTVVSPLVDGIIAVTATDGAVYSDRRKPVVFVDRQIDSSRFDNVIIDNRGGMYAACRHLIERGHRRIAYISGPMKYCNGYGRMEGFTSCMRAHELPVDERLVLHGDWFEQNGERAARQLLQEREQTGVTAILCSNNLICKGCYTALAEAGVQVGEELSLVGFDEHDFMHFATPKITYVARPTYEMGQLAGELLIQKMESGQQYLGEERVLPVELVEQQSVKELR